MCSLHTRSGNPDPDDPLASAGGMSPSVGEAEDVAPLPRSFDGTGVVVLAHEVHCLAGRYSVQDCETGQGCAGSAAATAAGDLDAFDAGASPCLTKDGLGLGVTAGQPEVWPAQPPDFPGDLGRLSAKQVDGVGRCRTGRNRSAKRAATDQAPGGKPQHTSVSSLPSVGHPLTVVSASGGSLSPRALWRHGHVHAYSTGHVGGYAEPGCPQLAHARSRAWSCSYGGGCVAVAGGAGAVPDR